MSDETERERHLRELTQRTIIDRENDVIIGDVGLHPIEYRGADGTLIKPRALPRTKRGEGVPGLTWQEQQERRLNAEREKIKEQLLIWARQEVARHITITRDSQAIEQGRADHWLLPELCRLEIPVQPE